jgi:hypothetical protein
MTATAPGSSPATISPSARDPVEVAETFEMLGAGIGDEPDARARERDQRSDVPDAVRAHLDYCAAMRRREAQKRQRHADVVIEIALRRQARPAARQDGRGHFLRRRLAVAPADTHERDREFLAPPARELLQRLEGVRHSNVGQRHIGERALDDGAYGPAGERGGGEIRAVEVRPAQGDEQRAGGERAAVGRHCLERPVIAHERGAEGARGLLQRALHAAAPRIFCASVRSLKLRRVAP